MQAKLLNLYLLTQFWNDGFEDHVLFRSLVRAKSEDHARALVYEFEQEDHNELLKPDDFERIANWRTAACELIGWATGHDQVPEVFFVQ
ncbi:MAG: hypothetical protein WDA42_06865 [Candidatus Bathyarchaeia archaeon]